jgi:hypothetical protein
LVSLRFGVYPTLAGHRHQVKPLPASGHKSRLMNQNWAVEIQGFFVAQLMCESRARKRATKGKILDAEKRR